VGETLLPVLAHRSVLEFYSPYVKKVLEVKYCPEKGVANPDYQIEIPEIDPCAMYDTVFTYTL
jgi:hypothetical protein